MDILPVAVYGGVINLMALKIPHGVWFMHECVRNVMCNISVMYK